MARPSKLTPEIVEKVLYALLKGNYRCVAAQYAGIGECTFKGWMAKGEADPESEYGKFRTAVLEAESKVEIDAVGVLSDTQPRDPKRIVEYLSRKFPERWATDSYRVKQLERELNEIKKLLSHVVANAVNPGTSRDQGEPESTGEKSGSAEVSG